MFYYKQVREEIEKIASQFQLFQCEECASAIQEYLLTNKIKGKLIKLETGSSEDPFGNIYHEKLQCNISVNGKHCGIIVQMEKEIVFDNIYPRGISKQQWLDNFYSPIKDFGGDFQITEIEL